MRNRIIHLDKRLGRIWSRIGGTIILLIGLMSAASVASSEGFTLATHWPGLAISGLFVLVAIGCFRSRLGLVDLVSDSHPPPRDRQ